MDVLVDLFSLLLWPTTIVDLWNLSLLATIATFNIFRVINIFDIWSIHMLFDNGNIEISESLMSNCEIKMFI